MHENILGAGLGCPDLASHTHSICAHGRLTLSHPPSAPANRLPRCKWAPSTTLTLPTCTSSSWRSWRCCCRWAPTSQRPTAAAATRTRPLCRTWRSFSLPSTGRTSGAFIGGGFAVAWGLPASSTPTPAYSAPCGPPAPPRLPHTLQRSGDERRAAGGADSGARHAGGHLLRRRRRGMAAAAAAAAAVCCVLCAVRSRSGSACLYRAVPCLLLRWPSLLDPLLSAAGIQDLPRVLELLRARRLLHRRLQQQRWRQQRWRRHGGGGSSGAWGAGGRRRGGHGPVLHRTAAAAGEHELAKVYALSLAAAGAGCLGICMVAPVGLPPASQQLSRPASTCASMHACSSPLGA